MTPAEIKQIQEWNAELRSPLKLEWVATSHAHSEQMAQYCDQLVQAAPMVQVQRKSGEDRELPAIRLTPNIWYHAVPTGLELDPFLEAAARRQADTTDPPADPSAAIDLPAALDLYIAPTCPNCPTAARQLLTLAMIESKIHLRIIDAMTFNAHAAADNITAVPTVILDGQFRWTGALPMAELQAALHHRDPAQLGARSLHNLLQEGQAEQVSDMVIHHQSLFPGLFELLVQPEWSTRLGPMVVLETVAQRDPQLAAQAVAPLWEHFSIADETAQGDIVYLVGEIADAAAIPRLHSIAAEGSEALKEAAQDAIASIRGRAEGATP
jgi:hypothetical protein